MNLFDYPAAYFGLLAVVVGLAIEAAGKMDRDWARPAIAVYLTTAVWYLADMAYNGIELFDEEFTYETLTIALVQSIGFLLVFRLALEVFTGRPARRDKRDAGVVLSPGVERRLCGFLLAIWAALSAYGLVRVKFDLASLLFPPLSSEPTFLWSRGAVGSGLDFLVSVGEYTHLSTVGLLGVLGVLARNRTVRVASWAAFSVGLQAYLFQPARNRILVVVMPPILAYILVGRSSVVAKTITCAILFAFISLWFLVIVNIRNENNWAAKLSEEGAANVISSEGSRHHGLNMLEELCFTNVLIDRDRIEVSWGGNYLANAALIIPRTIWPGKPLVGIDYAIARGFGGADTEHGVFATISGGMIGQGVQNFGPMAGPPAAALILAAWAALLARLWRWRARPQRFGLFILGMGLTFNLGRDITPLVLFPFAFSAVAVLTYEWFVE